MVLNQRNGEVFEREKFFSVSGFPYGVWCKNDGSISILTISHNQIHCCGDISSWYNLGRHLGQGAPARKN
jgi:hypothetical protein